MEKRVLLFKASYRLTIIVIVITIVATAAIGIISYINYRSLATSSLAENLLTIARISSSLIEPNEFREIMASKEPNDYHDWLTRQFTNLVNEYGIIYLHAGTISREEGFTGFVEAQVPGFNAGLGETLPAHRFPAAAFSAMARGGSGTAVTESVYAWDYGLDYDGAVLMTAYASVLDESGNAIGIVRALQVDTVVTDSSRVFALRMAAFAFVVLVLLAYFPLRFAKRRLEVPLSRLSAATNSIIKGDFSIDLERESKVFSKDELGVLSKNVTVIQELIRDKSKAEHEAYQAELAKEHMQALSDAMMESITYASKIQKNLLPTKSAMKAAFSDFSLIWKPRDIVSGDTYWMKRFDSGTVLCMADCTGHGTPGAFLTLLVTSNLDSIVTPDNCNDTSEILYQLDKRLANALNVKQEINITDINDGCDIVAMFIANDGNITFSSGQSNVFICDGKDVIRIRGQRIFVGEGKLSGKDDVLNYQIPADPVNKIYLVSDGLYEQPGGKRGKAYGFKEFYKVVIANHKEKQDFILSKVWEAFERYCGYESRTDDISIIGFKPRLDTSGNEKKDKPV